MADHNALIEKLTVLNQISETLNRAVDMRGALSEALAKLVELLGLQTGWVFLQEPEASDKWFGKGFMLVAHHNLPPGLAPHIEAAWHGGCDCQGLCSKGKLKEAYNEVRCSRLRDVAATAGETAGLAVHASVPLRSSGQVMGILNVAAHDWADFSSESLALLNNAGNQIGIALERTRLYDLMQRQRIEEQAALLDFSDLLLNRLDVDDLLSHLVDETRRLLNADGCALFLVEAGDAYFRTCVSSGWRQPRSADELRIHADERSEPGRVLLSQQPWLIRDVRLVEVVPRLRDWLESEGFISQAIVPLVVQGRSIGVLVINHRHPCELDEQQVRLLRLIANQAATAIERARLQEAEIRRQRIEQELSVATRIQLSLLPDCCPVLHGWEFAAKYKAARQVGGDFYDFFDLPTAPGEMGIVIADVSDKGVPAALFMAMSKSIIRAVTLSGRGPAEALIRANTLIMNDSQAGMFLSVFYGRLDSASGRLTYASAGHNPPLHFHVASGDYTRLAAKGIVLGVLDEVTLAELSADVVPGDVLAFYTDGVTEAVDADDHEFGEARLRDVIRAHHQEHADAIVDAVVAAVNAFTGDMAQFDDFTLVVVKRRT